MSTGLVLRADQMAYLDQQFSRKFVGKLRAALAEKYPQCLPSFPLPVQERIVANLLGRAQRRGLTKTRAVIAFAEMMLAIAPNFDEHPEVRTLLGITGMDPNGVVLTLSKRVSRRGWQEIEAATQDLPLFIAPELIDRTVADQTAGALPLALGDLLGPADPGAVAESALATARGLGWQEVPDAGLAVAAWRLLYGKEYRDAGTYPWVGDVLAGDRSPREQVAMLKYRLSLDHQRYV